MSTDYLRYLEALKRKVSNKMLCSKYTFDDVRELCIAAFWLSELSSALNGHGEINRVLQNFRAKLTLA